MALSTVILVIGPPLAIVIAYYVYKKKKKKKEPWYKAWETYVLSFVSSGWVTILIQNAESLKQLGLIDNGDVEMLNRIKDLAGLVVPLPVPVEVRLFILITIIIILLMIPSP